MIYYGRTNYRTLILKVKTPRQQAKLANLIYYARGKECKKCLTDWRLTSTGQCKECTNAYMLEYRSTYNARRREPYNTRPENKQRRTKHARQWMTKNPGRCRAIAAAWGQAKIRKIAKHYKKETVQIYAQCARLKSLLDVAYTVDHIIPVKHDLVCGLHVPWNLQIIPQWQNRFKSNKFEVT